MPAIRAATEAEEDLLRQRTELKAELAECKALLLMAREVLVSIRDQDKLLLVSIRDQDKLCDAVEKIDAALKDKP
jgi:hypothetical protein